MRVHYAAGLLGTMVAAAALPAEDMTVLPPGEGPAAPSAMLTEYLKARASQALRARMDGYEAIKSAADVLVYQDRMKAFMARQLGGLPERGPVASRVVGHIGREGFHIEKVLFESQPGIWVPGLVYVPAGQGPFPAVLFACGHSDNGKAYEQYQRAPSLLARNGIAAFCYDPIGQGERGQILDEQGQQKYSSTLEHTLVGVGAMLVGRNTAYYRVYDGMRAIDYLQGREDIDGSRIGCTGTSGGGTLTSYLMALDDRIIAAAPSCYLTSLERLLVTEGPQDAEQNIAAQLAFGMNHADYVIMRAPRPTLICCATRDFFDILGTWDSFRQAKRAYARLGAAEAVDLIESDDEHGFNAPHRVAMVRFMRRHLLGVDGPVEDIDMPMLPDEELRCTREGQVLRMEGARSVLQLNADHEAALAANRRGQWESSPPSEMLRAVRNVSRIRPLGELAEPVVERRESLERQGYRIEKLVLSVEPGIDLPALAFVPPAVRGPAVLWLDPEGKQEAADPAGPIESLAEQGRIVLAVDVRGVGETRPASRYGGEWARLFGSDWQESFVAYMLDKPLLAQRAEDVLVAARFLTAYPGLAERIPVDVVAIGELGPPALHAVALEPDAFGVLTLRRCIDSWATVVRNPELMGQLANAVHGALKTYDLPDLVRSRPEGRVVIEDPVTAP